jgi:hypothetical protein
MTIRTFQTGDDVAQVSIYNEAAGALPRFKPALLDEVRRRCRAADFDPNARFYALDSSGAAVGYATFQANGRISFPWCRKGHEHHREPLLAAVLGAMKQRGLRRAFAAYRGDWPAQRDFFLEHGFRVAREMINYVVDLAELPTPAAHTMSAVTPVSRADIPAILELGAGLLRVNSPAEVETHLFRNPYFSPDSLFALRNRSGQAVAVGCTVTNPSYAHPKQIDAAMPCFRLGAFGTEGLTHKRINGLFSFVAADTRDVVSYALDLIGYASSQKVNDTDVESFAAQAPSDAAHLIRFYKSLFRRQGSFPIFEREL